MRLTRTCIAATLVGMVALTGCGQSGTTGSAGPSSSAGPTSEIPRSQAVAELHERLPDSIKTSGVLRFAGDSSSPFRIVGGDKVTGLDPDIEQALADVLGVKAELTITGDNSAAREGIMSNRYDAANGPSFPTSDRADFGNVAYLNVGQAFLVPPQAGDVKSWADLCGKSIGAIKGFLPGDPLPTMSQKCVDEGKPAMNLVGLADPNTIVLSLKAGRVDAASLNEAIADYVSHTTDLRLVPAENYKQRMAVFTTKELAPVFYDAFKVIFANGVYDKILEKWGMTNIKDDEPRLNYLETQQ